jgi:prepilin-type N-terminal cleavage/methylation domain-containing protein/prepilin-type processing-associated H-X9-DG protein
VSVSEQIGSSNVQPPASVRRERAAFTLIELLVVIGIVSVLLSILLPAINNVRRGGETAQCLANLQQIGAGFVMYMNDHGGYLPPLEYGGSGDLDPGRFWINLMSNRKYIKANDGTAGSVYMCPSGIDEQNLAWWQTPTTAIDGRGARFVRLDNDAPEGADQFHRTNYALNASWSTDPQSSLGGRPWTEMFPFVFLNNNPAHPAPRPQRVNRVKQASMLALVFDGLVLHTQDWRRFNLRHGSPKVPALRRSLNVGYADGHADTVLGSRVPRSGQNLYWTQINNPNLWDFNLLAKPFRPS